MIEVLSFNKLLGCETLKRDVLVWICVMIPLEGKVLRVYEFTLFRVPVGFAIKVNSDRLQNGLKSWSLSLLSFLALQIAKNSEHLLF